jgi:CheY-like chemotaxis protein
MWAWVLHHRFCMFRKGKINGAASVGDQRTILIVDDDEDSRGALALVVEREGYQVFQAENGQQALDWIKAVPPPPGLILLDLEMPVMDGREFLSHLPGLPNTVMPAVNRNNWAKPWAHRGSNVSAAQTGPDHAITWTDAEVNAFARTNGRRLSGRTLKLRSSEIGNQLLFDRKRVFVPTHCESGEYDDPRTT